MEPWIWADLMMETCLNQCFWSPHFWAIICLGLSNMGRSSFDHLTHRFFAAELMFSRFVACSDCFLRLAWFDANLWYSFGHFRCGRFLCSKLDAVHLEIVHEDNMFQIDSSVLTFCFLQWKFIVTGNLQCCDGSAAGQCFKHSGDPRVTNQQKDTDWTGRRNQSLAFHD